MTNIHHDCPFCSSANTEEYVTGVYICRECGSRFDFNDVILEPTRHRISAILSANFATEKNPYPCEMELGEWCVDFGDGELKFIHPHLVSIFQTDDGIICFNLKEIKGIAEFDYMPLEDLVCIDDELMNR